MTRSDIFVRVLVTHSQTLVLLGDKTVVVGVVRVQSGNAVALMLALVRPVQFGVEAGLRVAQVFGILGVDILGNWRRWDTLALHFWLHLANFPP